MFRFRQIVNILLMLGVVPGVLWAAPQKAQKPRTVRVKGAEPVAQPVPPPPPPTLEQMPAQPPQVSYLNGQLTVISRNSTLADILHAVARRTGAVIELPPGAGMERVAGRMGPGAARNVLAELLNGSRYDYVMIASATNPGGLQHVILTPKSAGAENSPPPPATAYQPPPQQVMPNQDEAPPDATTDEQEIPPEEPSTEESASPQPQPTPAYPQPDTSGNPQVGNSPAGTPQQPGVKTPEQLLQELQRMQQLQQQQQQQRQNQQQE